MVKRIKLAVFLAISLFTFNISVYSCAMETIDWNQLRFMFFIEGLTEDSEVGPEYYKGLEGRDWKKVRDEIFKKQKKDVVAEWISFIDDPDLKNDIEELLYPGDGAYTADMDYYNWNTRTISLPYTGRLDLEKYEVYFNRPGNGVVKEYLEYVNYIRYEDALSELISNCRDCSLIRNDAEENEIFKADNYSAVLETRAFDKNIPEFLRRKFAFQAVKSFYRKKEYGKAVKIYESVFGDGQKKDMVLFFATEYYGKALNSIGEKQKALGVLLDLTASYGSFNADDFFMQYMMKNFSAAEHSIYRKNTADRIKQSNSYYMESRGMDVYNLIKTDPDSIRTKMSAIKNCKLMYPVWYGTAGDSSNMFTMFYMKNNAAKIGRAIKEKLKAGYMKNDPGLWMVMAAYMDIIAGDKKSASELLMNSGKYCKDKESLKVQYEIVRILNVLGSEKGLNGKLQGELVAVIREIAVINTTGTDTSNTQVKESLMRLAGLRLMETGDYYRAGMCLREGNAKSIGNFIIDIYASPESVLKSSKASQPIDEMYKDSAYYNKDDIYYMCALKYLRLEKYDIAFKLADSIHKSYWDEDGIKYYEMFAGMKPKYALYNDDVFSEKEKKHVSRYEVIRALNEYHMTTQSKDPVKSYGAYYAMASIFYGDNKLVEYDILWGWSLESSLEYEVNGRIWFMEKNISAKIREKVSEEYNSKYSCLEIAKKYLEKSAEHAAKVKDTAEFRAKCFMKIQEYKSGREHMEKLKEFQKAYGETEYYREFYSKCSWLREAVLNK